jgi:hypothetical protein
LLLSAAPFFTAGLRQSQVTTSRIYRVPWPPLRLLPQISLRIKLYRAILGCSKASVPFHGACGNHRKDGKPCHILLGRHPFASNPKVIYLLLFLYHISFLISSVNMQIDPRVLFQHIARAFLVHKLCGQTRNITVTIPFHQNL